MVFTPISAPGRPVCEAVEAYESSRPTQGLDHIRQVNLGIFIGGCVLWIFALWVYWAQRDSPRLRVVRPFTVSAYFVASQLSFLVGIALNLAVPTLPCGLLLFSLLFGTAGMGVNFLTRAAIFSVETQFAQKAKSEFNKRQSQQQQVQQTLVGNNNEEGDMHITPTTTVINSTPSSLTSRFRSLWIVLRLALGLVSSDDVSTVHLAAAKRSYYLVLLVFFLPAVLSGFLILALVPPFQQCAGCSIYLEIALSVLFVSGLDVLFVIRIMYVAWKSNFDDEKGVFQELCQVLFLVTPFFVLGGVLLMIDPNQVSFNREFFFEWILDGVILIYWFVMAGQQFYKIYKQKRMITRHDSKVMQMVVDTQHRPNSNKFLPVQDFLQVMDDQPTIKQEFEEYAAKHYAVENVHFVFDVRNFKRFFVDKGDSWKKQKARFLFETYIQPSSVMEVNISHETKTSTIAGVEAVLNSSDVRKLQFIFDKAVDDITINVLRPIWKTFELETRNITGGKSRAAGQGHQRLSSGSRGGGNNKDMSSVAVADGSSQQDV